MPQLDFFTFLNGYLWLSVALVACMSMLRYQCLRYIAENLIARDIELYLTEIESTIFVGVVKCIYFRVLSFNRKLLILINSSLNEFFHYKSLVFIKFKVKLLN